MNGQTQQQVAEKERENAAAPSSRVLRWHRRVLGFCLVIFALERGLFLVFFPWRRDWEMSWVPLHSPRLAALWMSSYFRGAISGLGLLNIAVAAAEFSRQVKLFKRRSNQSST
jgi:hypothetical protein